MEEFSPSLRCDLFQLSKPIRDSLSRAKYNLPEGTNVSVKSMLESLLPDQSSEKEIRTEIRDFCLVCAALASAKVEKESGLLSWIPRDLSVLAKMSFKELSRILLCGLLEVESGRIDESSETKLLMELMPEVLPLLKETIKESSIDAADDGGDISAASARASVGYAIVAAHQFRWFVTQGQGMLSFIHLAKNVNAAELGWYEDVILDICCRNIASDDELWHLVVEMSVSLLTSIQRKNPRSSWFEKIMNEMLSHLERQPRNKERYTAWLELIDPVFDCMGLVLLAHFRRIFPLLFQWMHSDNNKTVLLVLERIQTIIKLTWIRNSPYIERLVDELIVLYKEAALRRAREDIRQQVLQILILLQKCKGLQFEAAWNKHRDDPNLTVLTPTFCRENTAMV